MNEYNHELDMKKKKLELEKKRRILAYEIERLDIHIKNYPKAARYYDVLPPKADLQSRKRLLEHQIKEVEREIKYQL